MRTTLFCLIALPLWMTPDRVLATNTMCTFHATDGGQRYEFELIGYGELAMVQVNLPRGARVVPFKVNRFSEKDVYIDVVHPGSDEPAVLPPFTLKGRKDHVVFGIGGRRVIGKMRCQWESDAELPPPQKRQAAPIPPLSRP